MAVSYIDIDTYYEEFEEDKIFYQSLPLCLQDIVNELKSLEQAKISNIIRALNGNEVGNLNYNWTIELEDDLSEFDNNINKLGSTNTLIQNNIVVSLLNETALENATDLLYIQVIMHEAYHAYLVNYIRRNLAPLYTSPDFTNYKYYEMLNEVLIDKLGLDQAQHNQFIRDNMVDAIAQALSEYSNAKGYNVNFEYCEDLAWAGLQGTDAFDTYLSFQRRIRIEEIILAEKTNTTNGDYEPKGNQACN